MQVKDYVIPANTMIQAVMAEVLKGDHWVDGKIFRPERFLDNKGDLVTDERFIPFSVGKRQCLGETLAKTELFLFFTALVQQFRFRKCDDVDGDNCSQLINFRFSPEVEGMMPGEESQFGITSSPKPFKVRLTNRLN